jgi:hypothetical protein
LALFARLSNPLGQGVALYRLSRLAEHRGDSAAADDYRARANKLMNPIGPTLEFSPVINRGHAAYKRGDYNVALELLRSGYDQARQDGYRELAARADCASHVLSGAWRSHDGHQALPASADARARESLAHLDGHLYRDRGRERGGGWWKWSRIGNGCTTAP